MALTSYAQVQAFITQVLTQNNEIGSRFSPHGQFWATLTYDQFVNGNVPNVQENGQPLPILVKGNSAQSNIILALKGAAGTPFDPNTGDIGRMPANANPPAKPFFTDAQIQEIADWIDAGCPEGAAALGVVEAVRSPAAVKPNSEESKKEHKY